jgi:hypothetical protein
VANDLDWRGDEHWDEHDGGAMLNDCEHGPNRRHCLPCLRQWVNDLLATQTWHIRANTDARLECERLRRVLADHGIEEPPLRVRPMYPRREVKPPKEEPK